MTLRPLLWAAALFLVALPALACAPDAPEDDGRPRAAVPQIDERLEAIGAGRVDIPIDPGAVKDLDPLGMALNIGVTPPPCAGFTMDFTWQILTPDPPAGAAVGFIGERMGGRFEVGAPAASGEATIGCALLQAVNTSQQAIVVQIHFVIAEARD